MENKNDDIWVKSMKRYHKYLDEINDLQYDEKQSSEFKRIRLERAEELMKMWFSYYDEWFGVKRKINSVEEFNMIADLMGY